MNKNIKYIIISVAVILVGIILLNMYDRYVDPGQVKKRISMINSEDTNKVENTDEKLYEQATELVNHNYSNLRLGFYLDVSGLKPSEVNYDAYANVHFTEMNKNINEPNGLNIQVFNSTQWQKYQPDMQIKTFVNEIVYNGITFKHYTQPYVDPAIDDPKFVDFYVASNDGMYYVINSSNLEFLSKFGFTTKLN